MIGNPGNVDKAKNVGLVIAAYLKQYKLNLDFAPVADVNTNPKNKVIGNRHLEVIQIVFLVRLLLKLLGFTK